MNRGIANFNFVHHENTHDRAIQFGTSTQDVEHTDLIFNRSLRMRLLSDSKTGIQEAFILLFSEPKKYIISWYRRVRDRKPAKDLCQEVSEGIWALPNSKGILRFIVGSTDLPTIVA